jgi:hypothetical protein
MKAVEAVGTVVAVIAARPFRDAQPAAAFAGEAVIAGIVLVVMLIVLLALIFAVHVFFPLQIHSVNRVNEREDCRNVCKPPGLRNGLFLIHHVTHYPFFSELDAAQAAGFTPRYR